MVRTYRHLLLLLSTALLSALTVALTFQRSNLWAQGRPPTFRTAQRLDCGDAPPPCPLPLAPEPIIEAGPPCPPGPPLAPTDSPLPPADPPLPVVAIRVRVPAVVGIGEDVEYRIGVENTSPAPAHHVLVRNALPSNAEFVRAIPEPKSRNAELVWQLDTLEPGARREIILVLRPAGAGDIKNCARVQFEHGQCALTRVLRPQLSLQKNGPSQAQLHDALTYQLTVTNNGLSAANNVILVDTLPDGLEYTSHRKPGVPEPTVNKNQLTWSLGTLEPGQSQHLEYQVLARKEGQLCNQAVVTAAGELQQEVTSCVSIGKAALALTKTGPEQLYAGKEATYQISVTNTGTMPATNVQIIDVLPPNTKFVRASDQGYRVDKQVQWSLGTLEPQMRRTVRLTLVAEMPGIVINKARTTADRGLTAEATANTTFEGAPGLTAYIEDENDPVEVGTRTHYFITVLNQGSEAATNIRVSAIIPKQMKVISVQGPGLKWRQDQQTIIFDVLPSLAAKSEVLYKIEVEPLQPGDVRFQMDMTADQLTAGKLHKEASTTIYHPNPPAQPQSRRKMDPSP